jgi:hypothetical protein
MIGEVIRVAKAEIKAMFRRSGISEGEIDAMLETLAGHRREKIFACVSPDI